VFGSRWQKLKTRWKELYEILQFLSKVHSDISNTVYPATILEVLSKNENPLRTAELAGKLSGASSRQQESLDALLGKLNFDNDLVAEDRRLTGLNFNGQVDLLQSVGLIVLWNSITLCSGTTW
jgi:hypothetical protein